MLFRHRRGFSIGCPLLCVTCGLLLGHAAMLAARADAADPPVIEKRVAVQDAAATSRPSVLDEQFATQLQLTKVQKAMIGALLKQRGQQVAAAKPEHKSIVQAQFEKKIGRILTEQQRTAWQQISGAGPDKPTDAKANPFVAGPAKAAAGVPPATGGRSKLADFPRKAADGKIRFRFVYHPWNEVLDWFATQAGLSLVMEAPPPGTFNYSDDSKEYTPTEAIDLLNSVLLTKGYILVRREKMLMLIKSDEIPPNLVPMIALDELDKRGEFDLVTVGFSLDKIPLQEVEEEIRKLTGPQGNVILLPRAGQIQVTETAGRLRAIRKVIEAMVKPPLSEDQKLHVFTLKNALADQVMALARQFMGIPDEGIEAADGSIRIVVEQSSNKLLVSGKQQRIGQLEEIIRIAEQSSTGEGVDSVVEEPQFQVYSITTADPASVLAVLQTLLAGVPSVRLQLDPKTGSLVAQAPPRQHATIRAVIDEMQQDTREIEVIRLIALDAQLAVLAINKLFGGGGEEGSSMAPIVDADPISSQLLIRGTKEQITQIRTLLAKMGETGAGGSEFAGAGKGSPRLIPLAGSAARTAIDQVQSIWRRKNIIRVIRPSSSPTIEWRGFPTRPLRRAPPQQEPAAPKADEDDEPQGNKPVAVPRSNSATIPAPDTISGAPSHGRLIRFVQDTAKPTEQPAKPPAEDKPKAGSKTPAAEIVVSLTPGGILIASDDLDALDDLERLLTLMAETSGGPQFTVYYLKYEKVETAAEILEAIFGGGGSDGSGGGGLLGGLAGDMLGGMGGLLGPLLGGGGGGGDLLSGTVQFHPVPRLNAMIVQGSRTDVDAVTELLKVIDQSQGPEQVEVKPKPRFIPVLNNPADSIAEIVRQVYQDRVAGSAGRGQQRQPSPQELMQLLRGGGRGNRQSSQKKAREEAEKMTVSVDPNSNSLIVTATDSLFQEVSLLVRQLDQVSAGSSQITRTVTLRGTSPLVMQRALAGILGDKVHTNGSGSPQNSGNSSRGSKPQTGGRAGFDRQRAAEGVRRMMELQEMMRRGGGDRHGGDRRGGGDSRRGGGSPGGRSRAIQIPGRGH